MPLLCIPFPSGDRRRRLATPATALIAIAAACAVAPACAEKSDRTKPMTVDSSGAQPDVVDLNKHSAVFSGNVVITQGTLQINADRVEVREDPSGERLGYAFGSASEPARFRQKRDQPDEWSEGDASRIEYDSAANRVRFVGNAHLRLLRAGVVTDTASAETITYDTAAETIALNSGAARPADGPASGPRTTVVFTPRPSSGASAPAPQPLELPPPRPSAPASGADR